MKPNFKAMSRKELKAYVLEHRDDSEAISAYIEKSESEGNWVKMPPLKSMEDLDNYPEFLEKLRKDGEEQGSHPMKELQNLEKFGITFEKIKEYQILCLPENIETVAIQEDLIDTSGTVILSKLLKEKGVKCANSYDLDLETSELERRGFEIWLGVVYILDKAVLPILAGIISSLAVVEIQRRTNLSSKDPVNGNNTKIYIEMRILEEKEISKAIKFEGDPQDFLKILEDISDGKETENQ